MLLPPLELFVVMDRKPTINASDWTNERPAACSPFPFVMVHTMLHIPRFAAVVELKLLFVTAISAFGSLG